MQAILPAWNLPPKTRLPCRNGTIRTFESKEPGEGQGDWPLDPRRKEWTFAAKRASLSPCRERPLALSAILPRWRWRHCGASVVTALVPSQPKRDLKHAAQQSPHKDQAGARQD